ncbi:hypothetical protein LZG04_24375 [Saccharothrix sp. S26]|uniref:hypothetical protein n=1 Tax=Saccharothrix sp. S26 TaxID=2907215 RepID=UPI001F1DBABB|nr:hypothetical protein [Saccharothrix sp. S26]MCE6997911.1 hypothetical protein [Saccharothrix sp. S26]
MSLPLRDVGRGQVIEKALGVLGRRPGGRGGEGGREARPGQVAEPPEEPLSVDSAGS